MKWMYVTQLDVRTCIDRMLNPNVGLVDELNFFRLEVTKVSGSQINMIYKGRRFSKERRTAYLLSTVQDENSLGTRIIIEFIGELFNISSPMTPVTELDEFMKLALNASRIL